MGNQSGNRLNGLSIRFGAIATTWLKPGVNESKAMHFQIEFALFTRNIPS